MRGIKFLLIAAFAMVFLSVPAPKGQAQVTFGVGIGAAPVCPYGYYDYAPYNCSPYGYYGPEWFNNGLFIGAGPWYHGSHGFYGHVNNRFDPHNGYHGGFPGHGEHYAAHGHASFHGNEMRDGRGHSRAMGGGGHR